MASREKFHTFDALRFFSFAIVFLSHLPYSRYPDFEFLRLRGEIGVYFFFTLSGLLITYIILSEKLHYRTFGFARYMTRRILRIWPLYYLILAFAFATPYLLDAAGIPARTDGYAPNWIYSALFLENYMVIAHHGYANVSPLPVTWTVCIEEHFYLVWGAVLYFAKPKNIPYWIGFMIALAVASRLVFLSNGWLFKDLLTNFDYFMYGAIPAWLLANRRGKTLAGISSVPDFVKAAAIAVLVGYVVLEKHLGFNGKELIEPFIFGLLFMALLFILLPHRNRFKIGDRNVFSRLGKYTYGVYLLHVIAINFMLRIFAERLELSPAMNFAIIFAGSTLLTIAAAIVSYHFYEKPFIDRKPKYQQRSSTV